MKKFLIFIKNTWWLFILLFFAPIVIILVFAIMEYVLHKIDMSAGDWAGLFGAAFSYWGTVILGILAFWQNNQTQENNDMLINYERNKMAPIFSLFLDDYNGLFQEMEFVLTNCCDNIACNIKISDLEIYSVDDRGDIHFIKKEPIISIESHNILEGHSQMRFKYGNKAIYKEDIKKVSFIVTIKASDIIGLTRVTIVKIFISENLECIYEYSIQEEPS